MNGEKSRLEAVDTVTAVAKLGVGLGSTLERLATMYPERQTFSMQRPAEGGTEVRIAIPLRFPDHERPSTHDEQPAITDR